MARLFGGRNIELLAPAGTFEILREILATPCDAVYLGGQNLNMRMIRKGYNLSREELAEAVSLAARAGKALYIAVNSLAGREELNEAADYLEFLAGLGPSALIVQDPAVISLAQRHCPGIPLHASVMMNVHSLSGVRFLKRHGIRRVVLSREMPLAAAARIAAQSSVELEYFAHGDMCVAHGSQCLYSSYLFGQSSNRGRCLKPCRWPFSDPCERDGPEDGSRSYPLAVKDMNMIARIPDLLAAGISSLKIEGRMRQGDFIARLVREYAEALDAFLADPLGWQPPKQERMEAFRKRDWSTGYAFGLPGQGNLNRRGEGTGAFYSTGKMFSQPTEEREIPRFNPVPGPAGSKADRGPALTVRVNSAAQGRLALEFGPRRIYLSAEPLLAALPASPPSSDFSGPCLPGAAAPCVPALPERGELEAFRRECRDALCELYIALPRMMGDDQTEIFRQWLKGGPAADGFLVTHGGALDWLRGSGYALAGDWTLNAYSGEASRFWAAEGLETLAASTELPFASLAAFPADCPEGLEAEAVFHGLIPVMYLDHDVSGRQSPKAELETPAGRLTVMRDCWNRYHLFPRKELTLLPKAPELAASGFGFLRAEIQAYPDGAARAVLAACRTALNDPERGQGALEGITPTGGGFTYGAHGY